MTTLVASPVALDLSRLPAPAVIMNLDFQAELAALTADFASRCAAIGLQFDGFVESDPAVVLLQTCAYRIFLAKGAINDSARAILLAFATGADLDNLAAFYGIARLTVTPATPTTPAVMETDADLRLRVQLAPELLPHAGMTPGGYRGLALRAAPSVKDVAPLKREGGVVDLILLGREGDGSVPPAVVQAVAAILADDGATQLTDIVTVRSARIVPYAVQLTATIPFGPDPALVRSSIETAVRAYAEDRRRIGLPVFRQMLEAAASVGGVDHVVCATADVDPGVDGATHLAALDIQVVQR